MKLRKLAINTAIVFGTLALVFLLWEFRQALILFLFSLAIAAAARPMVEALTQRRVPVSLAIILVYLLFIGMLAFIFWAVGSSFLRELQVLTDNLAITYDRIWATWPDGSTFQQMIVAQLPAPADLYRSFSPEQQSTALSGLLGITVSSATVLGQFVTVLVLSIYWSIDRVHFERVWLSLLPVESRARSRDIWRNIEGDFGAYVRSELMQSIFAGLLLGLGLWALGVPYPTLLAVFAALAWFVPWMGGVLALLPIALVALTQGPLLAVFATLYGVAVMFFLEFFIEPRFVRRRQFSSLLSILLIIALIEPFGLMGLIVAPPLAAALELIFRYNLQTRPINSPIESAARISELRNRARDIQEMITGAAHAPEWHTLGLMTRLENLLERAEEELEKQKGNGGSRGRGSGGGLAGGGLAGGGLAEGKGANQD